MRTKPPSVMSLQVRGAVGFGFFLQRALLRGIQTGLVLLLLTPFVVSEHTIFPFVVGKALYSRAIIEVVFGLWALLVCLNPAFRPPRSRLLILLALGLAWSAVAAGFGVSPQRSLWSGYERMQGWVDAAHWFAFLLVAVSVLRSVAGLRRLLAFNLVFSVGVAWLAIAGYFQLDPLFYGRIWERGHPRIGTVFGNPSYLGIYALVNGTVALGFLAQAVREATSNGMPASRLQRLQRLRPAAQWLARLFWAAAAGLNFWAASLSGALTVLAGLLGGAVFLAAGCLAIRRIRAKRMAGMAAAGLAGGIALALMVWFHPPSSIGEAAPLDEAASRLDSGHPLWQRLSLFEAERSYRARLPAWQAGIRAFAERPLLGWGPENFIVAFGRHAPGFGAFRQVHDRAHNALIDKAATEGLFGLAIYLALWVIAFCIFAQAAKASAPGGRAFALFAGAALAGYFLQNQLLFDTSALKLQACLLFAFAIGLERLADSRRSRPPPAVQTLAAPFRNQDFRQGLGQQPAIESTPRQSLNKALRAAFALGGLALSVAGLAANQAIHAAASACLGIAPGQPGYIEQTAAAFPPLANEPRRRLFRHLAQNWETLLAQDAVEAKRLLAAANAQAQAAIAAEPENWRLHQALAGMHLAASATEPEHRALAEQHIRQSMQLAPNLPMFSMTRDHSKVRQGARPPPP